MGILAKLHEEPNPDPLAQADLLPICHLLREKPQHSLIANRPLQHLHSFRRVEAKVFPDWLPDVGVHCFLRKIVGLLWAVAIRGVNIDTLSPCEGGFALFKP